MTHHWGVELTHLWHAFLAIVTVAAAGAAAGWAAIKAASHQVERTVGDGMAAIRRRYAWRPDKPDARDYSLARIQVAAPAALPRKVSLRTRMSPVFDQGQLGSCTANAAALALAFEHGGGPYSRLQIYWNERSIEGTVTEDSGGQLRDVVKALAKYGAAPEIEWPYLTHRFAAAPPPKAVADGLLNTISVYARLRTGQELRQCLAEGFPVIFGILLRESFESDAVAQCGVVPMPRRGEKALGGHALTLIGYDDDFRGGPHYEVRNSWGRSWGDKGCCWIPAALIENPRVASDFWTIRK